MDGSVKKSTTRTHGQAYPRPRGKSVYFSVLSIPSMILDPNNFLLFVSRKGLRRCAVQIRLALALLTTAGFLLIGIGLHVPESAAAKNTQNLRISGSHEGRKGRDLLGTLAVLAQIGGGLAALVGLPAVFWQIRGARKEGKAQRTLSFQERYLARDFRTLASLNLAYLDASDAPDCIEKIKAWSESNYAEQKCLPRSPKDERAPQPCINDIQQVMGFFESMGTAYNNGELVEDVVHNSFAIPPIQIFTVAWWFICWRRDGKLHDKTGLYVQFQKLAVALRDSVEKRSPGDALSFKPRPGVRILMVPAHPSDAQRADWRRAKALSKCLSEGLDRAERPCQARQLVETVKGLVPETAHNQPASSPCSAWKPVFIPSDFGLNTQDARIECSYVQEVHHLIERLNAVETDGLVEELEKQATGRP